MSAAEAKALLILAALGIATCHTFAPHFQTEFTDKLGNVREHLPDYATAFNHANGKPLFIEYKASMPNTKGSFKAASNYIIKQHAYHFKCTPASYNRACNELWSYNSKTGLYIGEGKGDKRNDVLEGAWNHSIKKQLITQAAIGRENFVVVFVDELFTAANEATFTKYSKNGLHFLKLSQLDAYLNS